MIKAVLHRYFFYMGNAQTRKAGIYVKELCHAMIWVLQKQEETGEQISLFNMGMNPAPTIEDYVNEICNVAEVKRFVPRIPYPVMLIAAYVIDGMAKLFKINQPISPVRIRKLVCSNYIVPAYLKKHGYPYQYTFYQALEDWKKNQLGDWIISRKKAQEYKKRKE